MSLRGANPGLHWGLYVPTNKPQGHVWHATNVSGGCLMEERMTRGVPNSMSLCLVFKVETVNSSNWDTLQSTLHQVPADGQPSPNTGEKFSCRTWVEDSPLALHNVSVIQLSKAIQTIEEEVVGLAEDNRVAIEEGTGDAIVLNQTGFTTTST